MRHDVAARRGGRRKGAARCGGARRDAWRCGAARMCQENSCSKRCLSYLSSSSPRSPFSVTPSRSLHSRVFLHSSRREWWIVVLALHIGLHNSATSILKCDSCFVRKPVNTRYVFFLFIYFFFLQWELALGLKIKAGKCKISISLRLSNSLEFTCWNLTRGRNEIRYDATRRRACIRSRSLARVRMPQQEGKNSRLDDIKAKKTEEET